MRFIAATFATLVFSAALSCMPARANELPQPTEAVILSVTGKIKNTNAPGRADFDRPMLAALGLTDVETKTAWTKDLPKFRGVRLSSVLEKVGAEGDSLRAVALNDYAVTIPMVDVARMKVLLALEMNGAELPRRGKGPIWVIYPDTEGTADAVIYRDRAIWQLRSLDVR
ncbi:molybdopterin-dependent oxidoreductase [Lacibacterium aquatile]|uniref:Molybdopterin-dependent oxidoreductase n=1 Tax=Lacibacterium aquatile TaxID=1168082 RepID=A0ABW5DUV9_9PROT